MFGYKKVCEPEITYTILKDIDEEIIGLCEAKEFITGLDFPDFDKLIEIFIKAAREAAEKYTGLSIGQRTIQLAGDYTNKHAYMPFAPFGEPDANGVQIVGYTDQTLPADIRLAMLNMIHIAFDDRTTGLNFGTGLKLLESSRRRVGL